MNCVRTRGWLGDTTRAARKAVLTGEAGRSAWERRARNAVEHTAGIVADAGGETGRVVRG